MKKIILLFVCIVLPLTFYGQNIGTNYEIGYWFDINGYVFDGYFEHEYYPQKSVQVQYALGEDYTTGYYYDRKNSKVEGQIRYIDSPYVFEFLNKLSGKLYKVEAHSINGFVIGPDSFAVIHNPNIKYKNDYLGLRTPSFAKIVDTIDGIVFYEHTIIRYEKAITSYIAKTKDSSTLIIFPKDQSLFIPLALSFFKNSEFVTRAIETGRYTSDDVFSLVKMYKYSQKYHHNELVYYDFSWNETNDISRSEYYSKILNVSDSVIHLKYFFKSGIPISEGSFVKLYPHTAEGDFSWYFPNRKIRRSTSFRNSAPLSTKLYHNNGKLYQEIIHESQGDYYKAVLDTNGTSILDQSGNGFITIFDAVNSRELIVNYFNNILSTVHFVENGNQIYLLCEKNAEFKDYTYLQGLVNESFKYPKSLIKGNKQGIMLVACSIDASGKLSDFRIIR